MQKKSFPMLVALLAPALLTGCPVYVDSYGSYSGTYGSPDVVVVGAHVPAYIEYDQPQYTTGSSSGDNPIIDSFTQNINEVKPGQPVTFTVVAHDPNKAALQFNWSSTGGVMSSNTGRVVSWEPPTDPRTYTVTVVITNANGGVATGSLNMTVHPEAVKGPIATPMPTTAPTPAPLPIPVASVTPVPLPTSVPIATTASPTPTPTPVPTPTATVAQGKASVAGIVKDDAGPLAGADVILTSGDVNAPFTATMTTAADGVFKFTGVPAGVKLVISARKTGYTEKLYAFTALKDTETSFSFDGTYALQRSN
ncbi:MAG: hypothetical protein JWM80_6624 [Cyanobacteria bacterium RYN_339]|nr:hypothetical protein [Cyanobacteria bacterium RYN_339]